MFDNVKKWEKVLLDELWLLDVNAKERPLYDAEKVRKDAIASDLESVLPSFGRSSRQKFFDK